ncbi:MAG: tRNA lysidine(34) synthetase TilS [Coprobacillus sp.]|nr:tRNA lysidine(34) synthetase TilS [Coprobacillus sp.]
MSERFETHLNKEANYLLACSYGTDSMVLLYLLQSHGYHFEVAFVNYRLRVEADREEEDIKKYCEEHKIKVHVLELAINTVKGNIEASCRNIRYSFFLQLNEKYHYDALLVAHQQDDLLETYIFQKQRGSLVDYYGLKPVGYYQNMQVIRPLLDYSKKELTEILEKNDIPYAIDKTNHDLKYSRNKIRYEIVRPMSDDKREELLDEITVENENLRNSVEKLSKLNIHDVDTLLSLDDEMRQRALFMLLREAGITYSLSRKNAGNIYNSLISPKPNIVIKISKDLFFEKSYGEVRFYLKGNTQSYSFVVDHPQTLDSDWFYIDFVNQNKFECRGDDYPLTIRSPKPKDTYLISGHPAKINRLFIDWKVPLKYREIWPVIVNSQGEIIYIPHYQNDFDKTSSPFFYVKLG